MKNTFKAMNTMMGWIFIGTFVGIGVTFLKYLFSWNTNITNWILFSIAITSILIFLFKLFIDNSKLKRNYSRYMLYLDTYDLENYILEAQKAMDKTKIKAYQDIHRLNLSLGYAYQGDFKEAICLLMEIYDHSKPMSESALICIIHIISYYLYLDDLKNASKIEELTGSLISNNENHPKYGLLIQINRVHAALLKENIEKVKQYLKKAEDFQKFQKNTNIELLIFKAQYLFKINQIQQARAILGELKTFPLPPVFAQQINQLTSKLV